MTAVCDVCYKSCEFRSIAVAKFIFSALRLLLYPASYMLLYSTVEQYGLYTRAATTINHTICLLQQPLQQEHLTNSTALSDTSEHTAVWAMNVQQAALGSLQLWLSRSMIERAANQVAAL
jgi:hypothetical protein